MLIHTVYMLFDDLAVIVNCGNCLCDGVCCLLYSPNVPGYLALIRAMEM